MISHKLFYLPNRSKQRSGKWDAGGFPTLGVLRTGRRLSIVLDDRLGMVPSIPLSAFEQAKDRHISDMGSL
jgi:hypothetical protein